MKRRTRGYLQPVLLVGLLTILYGLAFDVVYNHLAQWIKPISAHLWWFLLGVLALLIVRYWKIVTTYVTWRFELQMHRRTLALLFSFFVISSGVLWVSRLTSYKTQHLTVAVVISLALAVLSLLYLLLAYVLERGQTSGQHTNSYFFPDEPFRGDPLPSQRQSVQALSELIRNASTLGTRTSIAIGIDGSWGDGKSSVVEMALNQFDHSRMIRVDFEPWRYTTQESLVAGFYDEIGKAIERALPGFQMARLDMAKFAQSYIAKTDKTGLLKALFSAYRRRPKSYVQKISNHLLTHNRRLMVMIDDVDRLYEDEHVMRTLQLAQYLKGDIPGSIILFLADMDKVSQATPERLRKHYLQKFFDATVTIVKPTKDELTDFINQRLGDLPPLKDEINLTSDDKLFRMLRNFRGVNRVLSSMHLDFINMGTSVNPQDVFFLRTIYYAYPEIYADIKESPSMYVDYDMETFGQYNVLDEEFEKLRATHFNTMFEGLGIKDHELEALKDVMDDYFPELKNTFRNVRSSGDRKQLWLNRNVGHRTYLARYFLYDSSLDNKHEVEAKVEDFLDRYKKAEEQDRTKVMIDFFADVPRDSHDIYFVAALEVIQREQKMVPDLRKAMLRDILRAYLKNTDYLVRDRNSVLVQILGDIDRAVANEQELEVLLENAEEYIKHPSTGLRMLLYMNPTRQNDFFHLRKYPKYEELKEAILSFTDKYYIQEGNENPFIDDKTDEMEWRFVLYQWALSISNQATDTIEMERWNRVNDYIMSLVKKDPQLLHHFVRGAFWQNDTFEETSSYHLNNNPQAYNLEKTVDIVTKTLKKKNTSLTDVQREELQAFLEAYAKFKADTGPTE